MNEPQDVPPNNTEPHDHHARNHARSEALDRKWVAKLEYVGSREHGYLRRDSSGLDSTLSPFVMFHSREEAEAAASPERLAPYRRQQEARGYAPEGDPIIVLMEKAQSPDRWERVSDPRELSGSRHL